ncbi:MAG: sodium:proton exchanger [Bacteroidetes bacterium]|nr:sodium:proton exchanger [Bacteroidota bacterium]
MLLAGVSLPFFAEIVALLTISVVIAYLCYRIHIVPIAGFLITGVIIGPSALGLVQDMTLINNLAEIGVILLLFSIGVEFSLEKLGRIKRIVLWGGSLQVGLTLALVTGLALAWGVDGRNALFTGGLVALSSTAIVLGLLSDRGETDSPTGQNALGILIFQDFAIIAMVLLVPLLGGQGGSTVDLLLALGKALGLVVAVLLLARIVVPRILDLIARTRRQELFVLTVVALCFGTAWLVSLANVSLALGAFLAGLVVSESPYSAQAFSEVLPLRTVFNAAFFVSVGMLLDLGFVLDHLPLVLGVAGVALLLKALITTGSVLALRYPLRIAAAAGLTLAQIGEFSFVLNIAGRDAGLSFAGLGATGEQAFIAATVLLMLITPLLTAAGPKLGRALEALWTRLRSPQASDVETPASDGAADAHGADGKKDHVIIVGYGPSGQRLAQVLQQTAIPFCIVELNPELVAKAKDAGLPVIYGDASREHILEVAGVHRAKLCVVAINDRSATERIVRMAEYLNPTLELVARARFLADVDPLHDAGADIVVPEELETAVRLFATVLQSYRVPPGEIRQHVREARAHDYKVFRDELSMAHRMVLEGLDEEGLHTRAVAVRAGAPAAGQTLADLALRRDYGLTVLAVRRGDTTMGSPAGSFRLEPGDRLVLFGDADQFDTCGGLFRDPSLAPDAVPAE